MSCFSVSLWQGSLLIHHVVGVPQDPARELVSASGVSLPEAGAAQEERRLRGALCTRVLVFQKAQTESTVQGAQLPSLCSSASRTFWEDIGW